MEKDQFPCWNKITPTSVCALYCNFIPPFQDVRRNWVISCKMPYFQRVALLLITICGAVWCDITMFWGRINELCGIITGVPTRSRRVSGSQTCVSHRNRIAVSQCEVCIKPCWWLIGRRAYILFSLQLKEKALTLCCIKIWLPRNR